MFSISIYPPHSHYVHSVYIYLLTVVVFLPLTDRRSIPNQLILFVELLRIMNYEKTMLSNHAYIHGEISVIVRNIIIETK